MSVQHHADYRWLKLTKTNYLIFTPLHAHALCPETWNTRMPVTVQNILKIIEPTIVDMKLLVTATVLTNQKIELSTSSLGDHLQPCPGF